MLEFNKLSKKLLTKLRALNLKPWDLIRLGWTVKELIQFLFFDE
ncbi:hypothetical protein NB545_07170 [Vibrio campbellii]|uniref:Uncharacterized protein n=1 Tax=Vibrio campbellii (strain ATCC BAA-1116) TaxID=2902295 RepID=A7N925_VIBC1|nr:hypothetical protein [Vibrio campbellii]ABU75013.1 hypothetical protein VIBHAR_p08166 [Vibrio campbellii ATCC BAA-1116]AGU99027.1 hypothetical protein M892_28280 [Vibrio campbellii ATCC BAA-1116]MCR9907248.1 hypothetical protein [Vibrio campbellii]